MKNPSIPKSSVRETYRHGDLKRALVNEGVALARAGGPQAVTLREITRRVGVVPNAAYRHFADSDALFGAVRSAALAELAEAIEVEWRKVDATTPEQARARALLKAVGIGYITFAQSEEGLFRTVFSAGSFEVETPTNPARTGAMGLNPFELLGAALDEMERVGILEQAQRKNAEFLAWSAVHGMAFLCLDGPLRNTSHDFRIELGNRLVAMVERGLSQPA